MPQAIYVDDIIKQLSWKTHRAAQTSKEVHYEIAKQVRDVMKTKAYTWKLCTSENYTYIVFSSAEDRINTEMGLKSEW